MNDLLKIVRKDPLALLPKISLSAWMQFWAGYQSRVLMEQGSYDLGYDRDHFHRWICERFQVFYASPIADVFIVSSFFLSEEAAFYRYFDLLEEYLQSEGAIQSQIYTRTGDKEGFAELVRKTRKCPGMYIGSQTFLGFSSMLMGDLRASLDMGLPSDPEQQIFREFQKWVEETKNRAGQFRHWFKIVEFWGGTDHQAYSALCRWLDTFMEQAGRPNIFKPWGNSHESE